MRLFVLAGGFGTRLKTTISNVPKALAPIGNVPFLQLLIEHWLAQGVREFTFLLHHQSEQIIDFLRAQQAKLPNQCTVDWLVEPVPMGTGGALAHAVNTFGFTGSFLMANADTWLGAGFREISESKAPAMAVVKLNDVSRYGEVQFDGDKRVTAFAEKEARTTHGWVNAGLCHLNTELFDGWLGQPFSLERDLFPMLVQSGLLTVVSLRTDFIDIGVPTDYHRFCRWVAQGREGKLCS